MIAKFKYVGGTATLYVSSPTMCLVGSPLMHRCTGAHAHGCDERAHGVRDCVQQHEIRQVQDVQQIPKLLQPDSTPRRGSRRARQATCTVGFPFIGGLRPWNYHHNYRATFLYINVWMSIETLRQSNSCPPHSFVLDCAPSTCPCNWVGAACISEAERRERWSASAAERQQRRQALLQRLRDEQVLYPSPQRVLNICYQKF